MRVGLDVGGTKTEAVALDGAGTVIARVRRPTALGPDGVIASIHAAVDEVSARTGGRATSVGIGMPGQIVPGSGIISHAVNLGVRSLDVAAVVGTALGVPVDVENDVKAAALGAAVLRSAVVPATTATATATVTPGLAYLNLGTGVAAGLVTGGALWRGSRGAAGEIGHLSVDPAGPRCRCGQRGCIEALAGGRAVAERWGRPAVLPVADVFDCADGTDLDGPVRARARELREDVVRGVAAAVRVLVLTADVDVVVLGGGLTALGDRLVAPVRAALRRSGETSPFLRSLHLDERIELLPAGSPAAALGAALLGAERGEEVLTVG
ncbi:putative NBD/HSP70 family sugar kinase [Microbacterium sp. AK009]|uniref:ROK family protein n=1 Tax=Microbacterium sp. AK009 TaxID=2723068 RepID=UPI0015C79126|nr:ROK family protein [Microbacterium sp. AK009]NYF15744.1 putative NBD/HSP70 family sugar kinase [Microbacterium sp. AK009]